MTTRMLAVSSCCGPVLALFLGGCTLLNMPNPPPWGYVNRVGDASAITEWTLRQVEATRIMDGQRILLDRALIQRFSVAEREAAAEGYLRVYRQGLTGWPVTTAPPREPPVPTSESILSRHGDDRNRFVEVYIVQAGCDWVVHSVDWQRSEPEMRLLKDLYQKMRPDPAQSDRYQYWLEGGRRVGLVTANDG